MAEAKLSILFPYDDGAKFHTMPEVSWHDSGMDIVCSEVTNVANEQRMIMKIMTQMTSDPEVAKYRADVFDDILRFPQMRQELMDLLEKIDFLKEYSGFKKDFDDSTTVWDLLHRLDELCQYIDCVEAIEHCLDGQEIRSQGLRNLRSYVNQIYQDSGYAELKKDVQQMKATTSSLKSITVGINLNDRFEAVSIGLISVNSKYFTKSPALANFQGKFTRKDQISDDLEWKENYKYQPSTGEYDHEKNLRNQTLFSGTVSMANPFLMAHVAMMPENDAGKRITKPLDYQVNHVVSIMVKKLKEGLTRHVTVSLYEIANLIPEFIYYVRWAEYIEKLMEKEMKFCKAEPVTSGDVLNVFGNDGAASTDLQKKNEHYLKAAGIYNMKLTGSVAATDIVTNDLDFDDEHLVYILTGANRGGKTTITQALGQAFIMAQGGIYVAGDSFSYHPTDCVYTHFPADEDKTLDYGRLGEECRRFKDIYHGATGESLLLLNESFATTSFEEGYYIARDSVRAILHKGIRTIYNTHMHKLAYDIDEINEEFPDGKAASLIVESEGGQRSYRVKVAPPEGSSYAKDIAQKYGVTYQMLCE